MIGVPFLSQKHVMHVNNNRDRERNIFFISSNLLSKMLAKWYLNLAITSKMVVKHSLFAILQKGGKYYSSAFFLPHGNNQPTIRSTAKRTNDSTSKWANHDSKKMSHLLHSPMSIKMFTIMHKNTGKASLLYLKATVHFQNDETF